MNVGLKKMVIMTHLYSINIQKSQLAKGDLMEGLTGQNNVVEIGGTEKKSGEWQHKGLLS